MTPLIGIVIGLFVTLIAIVLFNAIYDLLESRKGPVHPMGHAAPHITVIMTVDSSPQEARDCLKSFQQPSYENFDIVLANNYQKFDQPDDLAIYAAAHLSNPIYYYKTRKRHAYEHLIKEAYKRSRKGDIVVLIDSRARFTKETLRSIAEMKNVTDAGYVLGLQTNSTLNGFLGVILALSGSFERQLHQFAVRILPRSSLGFQAGSVFHPRVVARPASMRRRRYEPRIVLHGRLLTKRHERSYSQYVRIVVTLLLAATLVFVLYSLTARAVDGDGTEDFMIAWLIMAIAGTSFVLLDIRTTVRQKVEAGICFGFMPILIVITYLASVKRDAFSK